MSPHILRIPDFNLKLELDERMLKPAHEYALVRELARVDGRACMNFNGLAEEEAV